MALPVVSLIVPLFNAEKTIGVCLDAIFALDYPRSRYEVIVVDNGSTDASVDRVTKYDVDLVSQPDGTISAVRNAGARRAKGDILGFVDSDCVIARSWLMEALAVMADQQVGAAGSGYLTPAKYTWVEKAWLYESRHQPFRTRFLPGGNLLVRASVFRDVSGFDERLTTGEDADFCARVDNRGYAVINSCRIENVHLGNAKTVRQFVKKEAWYGMNMIDDVLRNPLDKVFCFTLLFMAGISLLLKGVADVWKSGSYRTVTVAVTVIAFVIFASGMHRLMRSRKHRYFLHVICLYFFYYLARSYSLIRSVAVKIITHLRFQAAGSLS